MFLNGVSYAHELGYRDILEDWERTGEYPVTYVPTVSRPNDPSNAGWMGRTGRVEMILAPVLDELGLTPANSVAYICGNPDMILAAEQTLLGRGYAEDQVKKELYWPKGKEPRGVAGAADLAAAIDAGDVERRPVDSRWFRRPGPSGHCAVPATDRVPVCRARPSPRTVAPPILRGHTKAHQETP